MSNEHKHDDQHKDQQVESHDHELGHIVPFKIYVTVFSALLALTVITVVAAKAPIFHFGNTINLVVAMLIASVKAGVVALFFMHLKYENPITWMYVFFPIFLLFIMMAGIFIDNPMRSLP